MKVELLILITGDDTFCNSAKSFIDFLKIDSQISVSQQKITFNKKSSQPTPISASFHVETNKVKSNSERYFSLTLKCDTSDRIDEFSELVDRLKVIAGRISPETCTINTLWDDIGRIYAERSYPIINETENLMRKLIAKFMLINVGMKWSKDAIQPELFSKIENFEEEDPYINDLHKLDFIHLSDVLFTKKRDISLEELDRLLLKTNFNQTDQEKILKYIPKSNWEKYFSSIVDEKDTSLEQKWSLLYKLRNKVAHNRNVKKSEFDKINGLAKAIQATIHKATEKLGDIQINEEERELIIHSYQPNSATAIAYQCEKAVGEYYASQGHRFHNVNPGPFEMIVIKNDEYIGVDIILSRHKTLNLVLQNLRKHQPIWSRFAQRLNVKYLHVVCIITDYTPDIVLESFIKSTETLIESMGTPLKFSFGFLDETNTFVVLYEMNKAFKALPSYNPENDPENNHSDNLASSDVTARLSGTTTNS